MENLIEENSVHLVELLQENKSSEISGIALNLKEPNNFRVPKIKNRDMYYLDMLSDMGNLWETP